MGTAVFGLKGYGIPTPGEECIDSAGAIDTIHAAVDSGINFFDTAPGYGRSEKLLGQTLIGCRDCIVATKVAIPEAIDTISFPKLTRIVNASLDASLRALRRDVLDIVQIHNATIPILRDGDMLGCLERAREAGKLRWIGASMYGPETALVAVRTGRIDVVQVALSLLDQRMCGRVLPEAKAAGVGVLARSPLLKGALTKRAQWLPESLHAVTRASEDAVRGLGTTWEGLSALALRFCLSVPAAHTILVGARNRTELQSCLAAESAGPLNPILLQTARSLGLDDELLLNPTNWELEESSARQVHTASRDENDLRAAFH
jgi:hypothetical protein